jgi:hypothetical protein
MRLISLADWADRHASVWADPRASRRRHRRTRSARAAAGCGEPSVERFRNRARKIALEFFDWDHNFIFLRRVMYDELSLNREDVDHDWDLLERIAPIPPRAGAIGHLVSPDERSGQFHRVPI